MDIQYDTVPKQCERLIPMSGAETRPTIDRVQQVFAVELATGAFAPGYK